MKGEEKINLTYFLKVEAKSGNMQPKKKKKNCCHDSGFLSYVVSHPDVYCEKETDPLSFIKFSIVFGYIWRGKKKKKQVRTSKQTYTFFNFLL